MRISPNKVIRLLGNQNVEYRSIRITGHRRKASPSGLTVEANREKTNLCCAFFLITWCPDPGAPGLPDYLIL
jgi:hypothetical protein